MLVGERMSKPVIYISPDLPINEALNLMKRERIRRTPVVQDGKLVGIVSDKDLLNASPSPATSLSVWEMNYLLSKITVKDVMTRKVLTVTEDTPIEEAARVMADNKIGGMPVMQDGKVTGIITETDLFKILLEMMGAREKGVRVSIMIHERAGVLAELTKAVFEAGGNFIALNVVAGTDQSSRLVTFKATGITEKDMRTLVTPMAEQVIDIRTT